MASEQKFCLGCKHLQHIAGVEGPAAYRCMVAVRMVPNFSPLRHTARWMRDGDCGKEAKYWEAKDTSDQQSAAGLVTTRR